VTKPAIMRRWAENGDSDAERRRERLAATAASSVLVILGIRGRRTATASWSTQPPEPRTSAADSAVVRPRGSAVCFAVGSEPYGSLNGWIATGDDRF
jgi:hypothetical protein